jgi:Domain of unknown function (DUF5619)
MPENIIDLHKVRFPGETFLTVDDANLGFDRAKDAAISRVRKYDTDPMLLSWYDGKKGKESPSESCEGEEGEPGWVNYTKARGGNLTVNVNHGEYIFIFRSEHGFPA